MGISNRDLNSRDRHGQQPHLAPRERALRPTCATAVFLASAHAALCVAQALAVPRERLERRVAVLGKAADAMIPEEWVRRLVSVYIHAHLHTYILT